ncbi:GDP-D-glucose phosphorylase 1 [Thelohanellus kitauei]|uniref:GDP-D-glucose phosphorylase 1 n=1 Tax=Thelohanellus kitauei TaxID=669202 RepID=A0A0C2MDK2_THEKT|nr:GDP-D-glucose phosphorylase 1 [Thelohanellus kitauei]
MFFKLSQQMLLNSAFNIPAAGYSLKSLGGKYNFLLIINDSRIAKKRSMPNISLINHTFDEKMFNFNKVKPDEIVFSEILDPNMYRSMPLCSDYEVKIIRNIFPIVDHHYLLVCNPELRLIQKIDVFSLWVAVKLCFEYTKDSTLIGFNSISASASVNHQHYHLFAEASFQLPLMVGN